GATVHDLLIHDHRAGAAGRAVADLLRPGEVHVIAQCIEQGDARLQVQVVRLAVDFERHRNGAGSDELAGFRRGRLLLQNAGSESARSDAYAAHESAPRKPGLRLLRSLRIFLDLHSPTFLSSSQNKNWEISRQGYQKPGE